MLRCEANALDFISQWKAQAEGTFLSSPPTHILSATLKALTEFEEVFFLR